MIDWVRNSTKYPSLKLKVVIIRRLEIICWTFKTTYKCGIKDVGANIDEKNGKENEKPDEEMTEK